MHSLRYEDLRANPHRELRGVLDWLGVKTTDEARTVAVERAELERMRELHPTLGERFFRSGSIGEGMRAFKDEHVRIVMDTAGDLLARVGYGATRTNGSRRRLEFAAQRQRSNRELLA